ncbi:MAG TPA: DUF6653 family protein [Actinopolymorphaceae bacterium]
MRLAERIAGTFGMSDEAWRRHANPWSVWTRFAAIPAMLLAIWSRVWLGWWCLAAVAVVILWLWLNPHVFPPIEQPRSWAAKGIYGEKLWLRHRDRVPTGHRAVLRLLVATGSVGFVLLLWGLVRLEAWPTVFGATVLVLAQLWRIDRFVALYETASRAPEPS